MQRAAASPQQCIPSTRRGRAALPFAARPHLAHRTGHLLIAPKCRPAHTGATVRILSPCFQRRSSASAPPTAQTLRVALRVRVAARPPVVAAHVAVMASVMTAVMPPHRGGVRRRRGVGVLPRRREDGDGSEQQREDERDYKFLHWVGSPLAGLSVSLTSTSQQARRRIAPGSTSSHFSHADGRNARASRRRRRRPSFRVFSRVRAPRRTPFTVAFVLAASKPPHGGSPTVREGVGGSQKSEG